MTIVPNIQIAAGIRRLEGLWERPDEPVFAPEAIFGRSIGLIRLDALSRVWEQAAQGPQSLFHRQERLLAGLSGNAIPWAYLVLAEDGNISVCFGLPARKDVLATWESTLSAVLPGCDLSAGPAIGSAVNSLAQLSWVVAVTGNPALPSPQGRQTDGETAVRPGIEGVFRALRRGRWAYLVLGRPVGQDQVQETLDSLAAEERELVSAHLRRGTAEENNNPHARHYLDLLRAAREKHESGAQQGMWDMYVFLLAEDREQLALGTQALLSAFAGPDSKPQPVRALSCIPAQAASWRDLPCTRLTSAEAAALARPPAEEFPGYQVRELVDFGTSVPAVEQSNRVALGVVLDRGQKTGNWFEVGLDDLCKHVLIAGVPGSGKTQTCQYLLRQLWEEHRIPWLVMEPAMKSEYRALLASPTGGNLRIFTLGDQTGIPLSFNPLAVQPGVHVQTHIDGLVALFNAAFALVTPMPYVLALALHRVYSDHGWDLTTGRHSLGYSPDAQPILSDLSATIGRLVKDLGYDAEITANIQAGLQTRLASLTVGGKGEMLNRRTSVPMDYLLSVPTVLEFAAMGNDEDKAFVLGAMLLHLAEHRRVAGIVGNRLRHVTVVEEAHRLLAAVPQNLPTEEANARGKAVESFTNLLAEVRAYGEGIVVVDQVPTKLAGDVLKNTNLKVVHRLVAEDERRRVGGCMNMSERQMRHLSTLRCGQAAVFAEGCPGAYLVQVPDHLRQQGGNLTYPSREALMEHMRDKLPTGDTSAQVVGHHASQVPTAPRLPRCPGCDEGDCSVRGRIVEHLLKTDHAEEFASAVEADWDGLWAFGINCANEIWPDDRPPADAPYCILMNIAALAGYDEQTCRKLRRNLAVYRDPAREQHR
jgi:hypothetical protein